MSNNLKIHGEQMKLNRRINDDSSSSTTINTTLSENVSYDENSINNSTTIGHLINRWRHEAPLSPNSRKLHPIKFWWQENNHHTKPYKIKRRVTLANGSDSDESLKSLKRLLPTPYRQNYSYDDEIKRLDDKAARILEKFDQIRDEYPLRIEKIRQTNVTDNKLEQVARRLGINLNLNRTKPRIIYNDENDDDILIKWRKLRYDIDENSEECLCVHKCQCKCHFNNNNNDDDENSRSLQVSPVEFE